MATNNDHTPEQEEFSRLMNDLRTMPRVKAPSNLAYLLEQRILAGAQPKESWWKRFFYSGFKVGGFRVPVYAYGPVAAALIVFFGIYVYNATNFESKLTDLESDQTLPQEEMQPDQDPIPPAEQAPALSDESGEKDRQSSRQREASGSMTQPAASPETRLRAVQQQPPAPPQQPTQQQPVIQQTPKQNLPPAGRVSTDDEDLMPKTRGLPDAMAPKPDAVKEEESFRDKSSNRMESNEKSTDAGSNEQKSGLELDAKKRLLESKGEYLMMKITARQDSVRRLDSLKRVDSLRNLNKQK